ncbi:MAG: hypothetical protein U5K37_12310 [Natrialbaceae archaeon]|nr:hypothetical protein [Natrialbaceae archaeon]
MPPSSTSEVIRPGSEREPTPIDIADRSSSEWEPIEVDGRTSQRIGEAGMAAMAMYRSLQGIGVVLPDGAVSGFRRTV